MTHLLHHDRVVHALNTSRVIPLVAEVAVASNPAFALGVDSTELEDKRPAAEPGLYVDHGQDESSADA